jgi:hypothetical protein
MQPLVEKYLKKHPELQSEQAVTPKKEGMTWRQVIFLNWGFWSVIAGIWVAAGNPKEGFLYCAFWGFVIASATIMTLAGCFARIWLAYHTPEIATNIYRGLSRR